MVRISKQSEKRARCPRRPRLGGEKTGPKKDKLSKGHREHPNAVEGEHAALAFIPKIR